MGRPIGLWAPYFDTFGLAYDAGGRLTELRYPNGVTETLAWNADDSLSRISHKNGVATLVQSAYTYDGLGRRKTLRETVSGLSTLTYTYQYDPLDRLTQVDNGTASQKQTYAYDIFGNRVQKQLGNPVSQTWAYKQDAANQLTEVRQNTLTGPLLEASLYDLNGQVTQKCTGGTVTRPNDSSCSGSQVTQYAFNSFDRLSQITGANSASFRYDDQGRRIQKTEGGVVTDYLYDGQNLYGEYPAGSSTAPTTLYVQAGLDHPLSRLTGPVSGPSATAGYYHADGLGSVLALTNASATVTGTQRFDAFGTKLAGTGAVPQYGYTGREPDATGLVYYRARYYDPSVGCFTARDPVGYLDGLNRYAYVGNNPVNFTDPNGLLARQVGAWWETQEASYHLSNRIAGGFRAVGGGAEAFLGGAACTSGVGCLVGVPVAVHGTDQFQAGLRQLWTGQDIDSFTSQGLQTAGLSRNTANLVDAGIGIADSLGSGAIVNSARVALVVEDVANNTIRVGRWMSEVEMNTMQSSGRVVEGKLNAVTSVTSPPDAMKWMNQTDGSHFVEFDILTSALRASDGVTGKIFGPNSIFGPKLGITEMPKARSIVNTAIKIQR